MANDLNRSSAGWAGSTTAILDEEPEPVTFRDLVDLQRALAEARFAEADAGDRGRWDPRED